MQLFLPECLWGNSVQHLIHHYKKYLPNIQAVQSLYKAEHSYILCHVVLFEYIIVKLTVFSVKSTNSLLTWHKELFYGWRNHSYGNKKSRISNNWHLRAFFWNTATIGDFLICWCYICLILSDHFDLLLGAGRRSAAEKEAPRSAIEHELALITQSRNHRGWKGPVKIIQSN